MERPWVSCSLVEGVCAACPESPVSGPWEAKNWSLPDVTHCTAYNHASRAARLSLFSISPLPCTGPAPCIHEASVLLKAAMLSQNIPAYPCLYLQARGILEELHVSLYPGSSLHLSFPAAPSNRAYQNHPGLVHYSCLHSGSELFRFVLMSLKKPQWIVKDGDSPSSQCSRPEFNQFNFAKCSNCTHAWAAAQRLFLTGRRGNKNE